MWWHTPLVPALGGSMSIEQVPGQPGPHGETLFFKKEEERKKKKTKRKQEVLLVNYSLTQARLLWLAAMLQSFHLTTAPFGHLWASNIPIHTSHWLGLGVFFVLCVCLYKILLTLLTVFWNLKPGIAYPTIVHQQMFVWCLITKFLLSNCHLNLLTFVKSHLIVGYSYLLY